MPYGTNLRKESLDSDPLNFQGRESSKFPNTQNVKPVKKDLGLVGKHSPLVRAAAQNPEVELHPENVISVIEKASF